MTNLHPRALTSLGLPLALGLLLASADAHAQAAPVDAAAPPAGPPPAAAPPPGAAPPAYAPPQYVPNTYGASAAGPQGAPPAMPRDQLERPRSIEEFKALRRDLREDLDDAKDDDRDAEVDRLKDDLRTVDRWYSEDTERRSGGAMAGGIVLVSVGGLSAVVGLFVVAIAGLGEAIGGGNNDGAQVAGVVTIVTGLGMVGGGIPLMIYGSRRVMVADNALAPPRAIPPAPRTAVVLGPGALRLEGSF